MILANTLVAEKIVKYAGSLAISFGEIQMPNPSPAVGVTGEDVGEGLIFGVEVALPGSVDP